MSRSSRSLYACPFAKPELQRYHSRFLGSLACSQSRFLDFPAGAGLVTRGWLRKGHFGHFFAEFLAKEINLFDSWICAKMTVVFLAAATLCESEPPAEPVV